MLAVAVTGWPPAPAAVLLVAGAMAPAPAMLVAIVFTHRGPPLALSSVTVAVVARRGSKPFVPR